jgi:GntR family transcriptional regulator
MATKYDRIAEDLRRQIADGTLPPGGKLPVETALAAQYHVSLSTIRGALGVLQSEGLVEKRHGSGNFVRAEQTQMHRSNTRYQWEKSRVHEPESVRLATGAAEMDTGRIVDDLIFRVEFTEAAANEDLAGAFGVPVGTKLLRREYETRFTNDIYPVGYSYSYLLWDLAAQNPDLLDQTKEPWPGGTQHQLSTIGIEVDRIIDRIRSRPVRGAEMDVLGLSVGAPVFGLRKISIDTQGRVVEVSDIVMSGERAELEFTTKLERWAA